MSRRLLFRLLASAPRATDHVPDAELLRRFVASDDAAAFELVVRRHADAVWATCRRVLRTEADADDAFQATFLALIRKARAVRTPSAGGWLHRVAVRTALHLRAQIGRARPLGEGHSITAPAPAAPEPDAELAAVVHEELARLPERERLPVVLCDLEGLSHADAAAALGWPVGTVSGRLSRARAKLRDRLTRRGLTPSAGLLPMLAAPPRLISTAVSLTVGAPPAVVALAEGVLAMTARATWTWVAVTVACAGAFGAGGVLALAPGGARPPGQQAPAPHVSESAGLGPGTDSPPVPTHQKITEGKRQLTELERELAKLNAEAPAEIGEWVRSGDLMIRVTGAETRDMQVFDFGGAPKKTDRKEIVVRVEVAPLSKTKRIPYVNSADPPGHKLTDERGRAYERTQGVECTLVGSRVLAPGAPVFEDVFTFEPPGDDVKELRMTIKGLQGDRPGEFRFRIPAVAWEDIAGAVKRLEQLAERDGVDQEKLRDAVTALKKLTQPPVPTEAQKARAKRSEELGAKIVAKRTELLESELAADTYAGLNEWVQVGDVRARVTKVQIRDQILVDVEKPKLQFGPANPWLMVRVEAENQSKKAVTYTRWSSHHGEHRDVDRTPPHANLADRHGNHFSSGDYFGGVIVGMKEGVRHGQTEIGPGGSVIDVVCFDEPLAVSEDLWLTLGAVQEGEKGSYRFKIPAAAWQPKR